jgi:hypothetical protein
MISAALLAISLAATVAGHHAAWADDPVYTASLKSDLLLASCAVVAFAAVWIGSGSRVYLMCVNLFFAVVAIANVHSLLGGEFVVLKCYGCRACGDGMRVLVNWMPAYVAVAFIAAKAAKLFSFRDLGGHAIILSTPPLAGRWIVAAALAAAWIGNFVIATMSIIPHC